MTRAARATRALAAAVALAALAALPACDRVGGGREPRVVTETRFLDELSKAIKSVNDTRARLVKDANAIGTAAQRIDDVDDVAVEANRDGVRARRDAAANALPAASTAARRWNKGVTAYERAIRRLDAADEEGLDPAQRAAVAKVVAAARAEAKELHHYARVLASVWPGYERLEENQRLWYMRFSNGWYRDTKEAAGAYVVLSDRTRLARSRRSLANADRRRLDAARATDAAIAEARGALASLLG